MSPLKDEQKKDYQRDYMRRKRGLTQKMAGLTEKVMPSGGRVTPALLSFLVDKEKRQKLERIVEALSRRELGGEVRFGIGGVNFKEVEDILEVTNAI